jgi:hypothetical protein
MGQPDWTWSRSPASGRRVRGRERRRSRVLTSPYLALGSIRHWGLNWYPPQYSREAVWRRAREALAIYAARRATIIPSRRMPSEGERRTPAHVRRTAKDKDVP